MKRVGVPLRECDARYLTGRPSFTLSSWGEAFDLNSLAHSIGDTYSHADLEEHGSHKRRSKLSMTKSVNTMAHLAEIGYMDAKIVYASTQLPLMSHVWYVDVSAGYSGTTCYQFPPLVCFDALERYFLPLYRCNCFLAFSFSSTPLSPFNHLPHNHNTCTRVSFCRHPTTTTTTILSGHL
jgi:hypothetical protein